MDERMDLLECGLEPALVVGVADRYFDAQRSVLRDIPADVHADLTAGIEQARDERAADAAGCAGYEDGHGWRLEPRRFAVLAEDCLHRVDDLTFGRRRAGGVDDERDQVVRSA